MSRDPNYSFIWPKDPLPGNPRSWPRGRRLKDVLTGKGPDIYTARMEPRAKKYGYDGYGYGFGDAHDCDMYCTHGRRRSYTRTGNSNGEYNRIRARVRESDPTHTHTHTHADTGDRKAIMSYTYDSARNMRILTELREPKVKEPKKVKMEVEVDIEPEIHIPRHIPTPDRKFRRTGWSLWEKDHLRICRDPRCDECERICEQEERDNAIYGAKRGSEERYDFRRRKYVVPDSGSWSFKVHCDDPGHVIPRVYWDALGRRAPVDHVHDVYQGSHGDRRRRW